MPVLQGKTQVNRELQRLGLGHLKDPNLIENMAFLVRDHAHFRGILMHMPMPERKEAYDALAPKLRFKALSLEDYEIAARTLAEQKQLPHYDPKTLEAKEWKPQEFHTRRADVSCDMCEAGHAVTGDGKWHHYGTPEQTTCAQSWLYPDGYPVAPSHPRIMDSADKNVKVAERAIAQDLREAGATQQLTLVCRQCTFEQSWRVKRRTSAYKLARQDGWQVDKHTALCRLCKSKSAIN